MRSWIWLTIFAATMARAALASQFALVVDPNLSLNDWERERVMHFLKETQSKIPIQIQEQINRPIVVKFAEFSSDREYSRTQIQAPNCSDPKFAQGKKQGYGYVKKPLLGSIAQAKQVYINQLFLAEILGGIDQARTYPCGHQNFYRLAQGTVIHEIGHIYEGKGDLSKNPRFQNLVGFRPSWILRQPEQKNTRPDRSPDAYEFNSPEEAFSVNLEYFALDPEFACRRPTIYRYYERELGLSATHRTSCRMNFNVNVSDTSQSGSDLMNLNPDRVYDIDYLLAAPGESFETRGGHAMFRIVLCAPHRKEPGPECRKDLAHHVVVSYRANVDDVKLSPWKGLTGGYDSKMYLFNLISIIEEYNHRELRPLKSLSLRLSTEERKDFIYRVLEQNWSYLGKYKFLSQNCETESEDFLKAVVAEKDVQSLSAWTPVGLGEQIERTGLTSGTVDTFHFTDDGVLEAFNEIRAFSENMGNSALQPGLCGGIENYFLATSAENRKSIYEALVKNQDEKSAIAIAADFFILERELMRIASARKRHKILKMIYSYIEDPESFEKTYASTLGESFKQIKQSKNGKAEISPLLKSGYGVALSDDFNRIPNRILELQQTNSIKVFNSLLEAIERSYASKEKETESETKKNVLYFRDQLIK